MKKKRDTEKKMIDPQLLSRAFESGFRRIRVDDLHKKWMKDSKYRREHEAMEEEFSLVAALIKARTRAGLTQEQVARRMKTTQTELIPQK